MDVNHERGGDMDVVLSPAEIQDWLRGRARYCVERKGLEGGRTTVSVWEDFEAEKPHAVIDQRSNLLAFIPESSLGNLATGVIIDHSQIEAPHQAGLVQEYFGDIGSIFIQAQEPSEN